MFHDNFPVVCQRTDKYRTAILRQYFLDKGISVHRLWWIKNFEGGGGFLQNAMAVPECVSRTAEFEKHVRKDGRAKVTNNPSEELNIILTDKILFNEN